MKRSKAPAARPEPARDGDAVTQEGPPLVRLNKYLADNGIASRRHADRMIAEGEVLVDGELVTELGTRIDPERQRVEVDGVVLRKEGERHRYFLLSKPKGVVCTNDAREGKRRAIDLITDKKSGRIYTVGRLDEDTTGLVLITNDGEFANRIGHPRYEVPKIYRLTLRGRIGDMDLDKVRRGVRVAEFRADFEWVKLAKRSEHQTVLLLRLNEGRNREIRRVFAKLGYPVKSLHRAQIGPIHDRGLKVGHWRPLTRDEVEALLAASRGELQPIVADRSRKRALHGRRRDAAAERARTIARIREAPQSGGRPPGRRDRGAR